MRSDICRFMKHCLGAFSRGPGGFRELREACGIHFHLSWYLSDAVVPSYGQKHWGHLFPSTVCIYCVVLKKKSWNRGCASLRARRCAWRLHAWLRAPPLKRCAVLRAEVARLVAREVACTTRARSSRSNRPAQPKNVARPARHNVPASGRSAIPAWHNVFLLAPDLFS